MDDKPHFLDDLVDLGILALMVFVMLAVTIIGLVLSDGFVDMLGRMGLHGAAVSFIGHVVGFALTVLVVVSILGRVVNQAWWWRT